MNKSSVYAQENSRLNILLSSKKPALVAHRGGAGGSIIENTAQAVIAALKQGSDIVEIDVIMSTDGDFFCFHDGYESMHFGLEQNMHAMTTAQIEALRYRWYNESQGVERLQTLLERFPDVIFNLDRSWKLWATLLPFLDRHAHSPAQILLKSPPGEHVSLLAAHPVKYPFMPICTSETEIELCLLPELNVVGLELLASTPDSPFLEKECLAKWQARGLFVMLNALNLPSRKPLFMNMDDETAVLYDPEESWGKLIALGADVIQTDWCLLFRQWQATRAKDT